MSQTIIKILTSLETISAALSCAAAYFWYLSANTKFPPPPIYIIKPTGNDIQALDAQKNKYQDDLNNATKEQSTHNSLAAIFAAIVALIQIIMSIIKYSAGS